MLMMALYLLFREHSPFDKFRNAIGKLVHYPGHVPLVVELDMQNLLAVD